MCFTSSGIGKNVGCRYTLSLAGSNSASRSPGDDAWMSTERATQIETPSLRRVYTSRALRIAISASAACRLPTCLCASPCCERMKTSHSGHSFMGTPNPMVHAAFARVPLLRVRERGLAHPRAVFPRRHPRAHPVAIAGPVAAQHRVKLVPVDLAEVVVPAF